ncbi:MAG: sulfatase-like hydrolase/transferase [Polyangiaceae bacterium]
MRPVERAVRHAAFGLFALQFVLLDCALRGKDAALITGIPSAVAWGGLALVARSLPARVALALVAGALSVVEVTFFRNYHGFVDVDAALAARRMWTDVAPVLRAELPSTLALVFVTALVELGLLGLAPKARKRPIALAACASLAVLPWLGRGPDATLLRASRALFGTMHAPAAGNVEVGLLPSRSPRLPHVLVLLTESVRASDYCKDPGTACETAPETARRLPNRTALLELRSLGSYTAIAVNALLAGRMPLGNREEIARTPLVFDYARSIRARDGSRPHVHYWSAQTDSLFERADVRSAVDSMVTLDELFGRKVDGVEEVIESRADERLAAHVERELPGLAGPLFVFLHLSGTHAPYYVDPERAPFRPYRHVAGWSGLEELHAAYKNAIVAQDQSVKRMLDAFLQRVAGEPYVVIFTSDHGEAFGEHKAILHGQNVYDEQIHVPGFVAASNGALSQSQSLALASHGREAVTHLDIVPTLLDVWGVWSSFAMTGYRAHLPGRTLLEPFPSQAEQLPVTNCTELFPCPLKNWGVLGRERVLVSQAWDAGWRCADLGRGELEVPLVDPECARLVRASYALWPTLPNGSPNR